MPVIDFSRHLEQFFRVLDIRFFGFSSYLCIEQLRIAATLGSARERQLLAYGEAARDSPFSRGFLFTVFMEKSNNAEAFRCVPCHRF